MSEVLYLDTWKVAILSSSICETMQRSLGSMINCLCEKGMSYDK